MENSKGSQGLEVISGAVRESSLPRDAYFTDAYFDLPQLFSLSHQLNIIWSLKPSSVIEIGIGNGFVSNFLRSAGVEVVTVDINPSLNPDICCPIADIPARIGGRKFDLVVCCEVLEHMPFEELPRNLEVIKGLSDKAFITLPIYSLWFGFSGFIKFPRFEKAISLGFRLRRNKSVPQHFWEVDSHCYSRLSALKGLICKAYHSVETGVFKMNGAHRYFICR